jgi:hypothetical protein
VKTRSYRRATLNDLYPFKNTASIEIVSFEGGHGDEPAPTVNGVIDQSRFKESRKLTSAQEEELVDILYNYTFDPKINKDSITMLVATCYEPRNAIIFKSKKGEVTAWMEICFECKRHTDEPDKFTVIEFCGGKYEMIRNFMIKMGIKYGTIETDEIPLEDKSH